MRVSEGYSGASEWDWWGSWGDPGRGRVQICHKGAPGRDRSRRKPRNINDSSCAPRLDWGLCGRFGHGPGPDRVRTGSDWSHATRAPHLSQVPLLAAPPGAEHGAPGGSFRGAPDCEAVRTAQSCGNRRTHPGRRPERSSQGARIGSGPWAPLAPDLAAERPCNRFGHTPPHKPHTPHSDTPRITFPVIEPFSTNPRTGQDRCDGARGPGATQGSAAPCAPRPLRTRPSRATVPTPGP